MLTPVTAAAPAVRSRATFPSQAACPGWASLSPPRPLLLPAALASPGEAAPRTPARPLRALHPPLLLSLGRRPSRPSPPPDPFLLSLQHGSLSRTPPPPLIPGACELEATPPYLRGPLSCCGSRGEGTALRSPPRVQLPKKGAPPQAHSPLSCPLPPMGGRSVHEGRGPPLPSPRQGSAGNLVGGLWEGGGVARRGAPTRPLPLGGCPRSAGGLRGTCLPRACSFWMGAAGLGRGEGAGRGEERPGGRGEGLDGGSSAGWRDKAKRETIT